MIACRNFLGVNLLAKTCIKSKPLFYFQKYELFHGLSCGLEMEDTKRKQVHFGRKKGNVAQTWRAVSSHRNCDEVDADKGKPQSQLDGVHHVISSTASTSQSENVYPKTLNDSVGLDTHPRLDVSTDENLEKQSVAMEIGWSLMRFVKGKGGVTQEEIEEETGVKIKFPSSKNGDSIIIEGDSDESVQKASQKIQMIIDKAVNSRDLDYSHFVSLPLAIHPGLVDKLVNFQNTILGLAASDKDENLKSDTDGDTSDEKVEDQHPNKASKVAVELKAEEGDAHVKVELTSDKHSTEAPVVAVELQAKDADTPVKVIITNIPLVSYRPKESKASAAETSSSKLIELGIDKSIFIKPRTFHLTVLMLKLWNKERVKTAAEVLQSVSQRVIDALENRPLLIRLKGLDSMKGSLAKAQVIYAPVEEIGDEGRLIRACQVISDAFIEAGLVIEKDVQQKLKLHATLMNARHRKRKKRSRKVDPFDARGIFDLYGSEEWGEYPIREAHLSQRFVFDENGYYHCCASVPFPEYKQAC